MLSFVAGFAICFPFSDRSLAEETFLLNSLSFSSIEKHELCVIDSAITAKNMFLKM